MTEGQLYVSHWAGGQNFPRNKETPNFPALMKPMSETKGLFQGSIRDIQTRQQVAGQDSGLANVFGELRGILTQKAHSAREEFRGQRLPHGLALGTVCLAHSAKPPSRSAKPRLTPAKQRHQNFTFENIHNFYFKRSIKVSWKKSEPCSTT